MYCGDEVGAIVADVGNFSSKFGYAGKDTPHHVFHTNAGTYVDTMEDKEGWVLGDANLRVPREGFEIYHPFQGDDINWDMVEALFRHGVGECKSSQILPLMLARGEFNTLKKQEKLMEILFESLNLPALYLTSNAALSSFCSGRPTSLVVDIGAAATRITPIVDGYALQKSTIVTPKGGFWLDAQLSSLLEQNNVTLYPFYESKKQLISSATQSHRSFFINEVVRDIKHWMSVVRLSSTGEPVAVQDYILPDGTAISSSAALTHVPELLFTSQIKPRHVYNNTRPAYLQEWDVNVHENSLPELIYDAVMKSDLDCRKDLFSNIVVVGGSSLIEGMGARIQADVGAMLPSNVKAKVVPQLPIERQFSAWIGGSILGICGSFQQLWLSDIEYHEHGAGVAAERFTH